MVKLGIISDTHITENDDPKQVSILLNQLHQVFKDVDEIIHAGDINTEDFLNELKKIAPTKCVAGNMDKINDLNKFIKFSIGKYNIGVIHKCPWDLKNFFKKNNLHILIHGHSHQPIIKGTQYNTLILNPGSPTKPKAPPPKIGFKKPVARKTVITLEINEKNMLTSFIITLR